MSAKVRREQGGVAMISGRRGAVGAEERLRSLLLKIDEERRYMAQCVIDNDGRHRAMARRILDEPAISFFHEISVAEDFSKQPSGRYRSDGPNSAQRFREEILVPALRGAETQVHVKLDGTLGYSSAFLEEAFGGLVTYHRFKSSDLNVKLVLESESDPSLSDEIWQYILDAENSMMEIYK